MLRAVERLDLRRIQTRHHAANDDGFDRYQTVMAINEKDGSNMMIL